MVPNLLQRNGRKEGCVCLLAKMGIKARLTAIRNPCTNAAERVNREINNFFRIFMKEEHHHDTIGTMLFEAHFKRKPRRAWAQYSNKNIVKEGPIIKDKEIHISIKEKRMKAA